MEKPRITQCGDGHLQCVIYGLGPYITDYPKQTLLACVVSGLVSQVSDSSLAFLKLDADHDSGVLLNPQTLTTMGHQYHDCMNIQRQ